MSGRRYRHEGYDQMLAVSSQYQQLVGKTAIAGVPVRSSSDNDRQAAPLFTDADAAHLYIYIRAGSRHPLLTVATIRPMIVPTAL